MADAADILDALPFPAAEYAPDGTLRAANDAFRAAGQGRVLADLAPGQRMETHGPDGSWTWCAAPLPHGGRLISGDKAAAGSPPTRERYLAALSHELRTPLNGVLGMANLLGRTRLDADQSAYVAALKESGDHLLGLVNDVLDLAKLESGQIDLEPHPVDIERVLQGVTELLSPRAHEKGLEIAWAAPALLPTVMADDGRLRQILFNLAGNAVKFTDKGGVLLTVSTVAEDEAVRLRFTVADTGPGVPEADQARIFEEFARLEGAQQRIEGAGLGLAIVRRLARAHEGTVGLSSRPGGGTAFWFEARFQPAAPARPAALLAGLTVAVVTPSAIVRDAACRQIEACGGGALAYPDLAAARHAPAGTVMLIDGGSGPGRRTPKPPAGRAAIVLLAPEERGRIAGARRAGYGGYLIKPLRRASLAERVRAALDGAGAAPPPPPPGGLKVLLAEDNPINALLARSLLEREGCAVDRAADGAEAVEAASVCAYDLILMDVRMPRMDGLQAAAALRARGLATPIVALTANAFEDDRKACLAAGMDDFLCKPLDLAALRALLGRWTPASGAGFTPARREAKLAR